ncbi:hypothetical protein AGOR_G00125790 [Albula goreensis]|uniref:SEA domain-containing protein n=1 Tax=Albula goreensis TaxID=1534307 RepID=A0A8T3DBS2_9TELE|nr:hypothetical protein AGOR_G00125790 [Albula goreensis]
MEESIQTQCNERDIKVQVAAGEQPFPERPEITQSSPLLSDEQREGVQSSNGARVANGQESLSVTVDNSCLHSGQEEPSNEQRKGILSYMNRVVVCGLRLWMILVLILLLITALVITLSLVLYSVLYEDEDDTFDHESFVVPMFYSGTLSLVNQNFSANLPSALSNQSLALSNQLKEKLSHIYSSSPALGRYFSEVGMYIYRNGTITAHYWLKFLMPLDHEELVHYTLSQEMVYNVLRQHLYDQEVNTDQFLYIDPATVYMEVGNRTLLND